MSPDGGVLDLLVEAELVTVEEAEQARLEAERTGESPAALLIARTDLAPAVYVETLRRRTGLGVFDEGRDTVDVAAARRLGADMAARLRVIPVAVVDRGGRQVVKLAMSDPLDAGAAREVAEAMGCEVEPLIAAPDAVARAIERHYRHALAPSQQAPRRGGRRSGEIRTTATRLAALRAIDLHRPTPVQRVTALVNLLVDKGVIDYDEYEQAVRSLLYPDAK